jgi:hypothetical protein
MLRSANPRRAITCNPRYGHLDRSAGPTPSIGVRIRAAARRGALTARLARGADPTASPELTLRASQLTSERRRRRMARTLRRTVSEARHPSTARAFVSIASRCGVLGAGDAFQMIIGRLASPDPVAVKGMAMLERIITDGASSPLYDRFDRSSLRRELLAARAELEPTPLDLPIVAWATHYPPDRRREGWDYTDRGSRPSLFASDGLGLKRMPARLGQDGTRTGQVRPDLPADRHQHTRR